MTSSHRTRSSQPTLRPPAPPKILDGVRTFCTAYGLHRREMFPEYFFCSQCDQWDITKSSGKKVSAASQVVKGGIYECKAKHFDSKHPTETKAAHTYCPSKHLIRHCNSDNEKKRKIPDSPAAKDPTLKRRHSPRLSFPEKRGSPMKSTNPRCIRVSPSPSSKKGSQRIQRDDQFTPNRVVNQKNTEKVPKPMHHITEKELCLLSRMYQRFGERIGKGEW